MFKFKSILSFNIIFQEKSDLDSLLILNLLFNFVVVFTNLSFEPVFFTKAGSRLAFNKQDIF